MPDKDQQHANAIFQGLLRKLEGGASRPRHATRIRGAVRTRGAAVPSAPPSPVFLLVEVPQGKERPGFAQLRSRLPQGLKDRPLDIYYLVSGKQRVALGPRELDPEDEDDKLFIAQLAPAERI